MTRVATAPSKSNERWAVKGPRNLKDSNQLKVNNAGSSLRMRNSSSHRPINLRLGQLWHKTQNQDQGPLKDCSRSPYINLPATIITMRRASKITTTTIKIARTPSLGNNKSINLRTIRAGKRNLMTTPTRHTTTLRTLIPAIRITRVLKTTM